MAKVKLSNKGRKFPKSAMGHIPNSIKMIPKTHERNVAENRIKLIKQNRRGK